MSRIGEALRRAATSEPNAQTTMERGVLRGLDEYPALTHYPTEQGDEQVLRAALLPRPGTVAREIVVQHAVPTAQPRDGKPVLGQIAPLAVEQYRRLAAALHGLQTAQGTKIVMVASALPQEGKTLTITNLALTLSESYGRRVLLIDADLRRPSLHEMLQLSNAHGLSEGFRHERGALPLVEFSSTLWVLPAGNPNANPMADLTSDRMRVLLEESASKFDWVLVDTPPVGIMPDAHLLAALTDGVLLVIGAGSTPYNLIERAIADIGRERIIGTVLNRVEEASIPAMDYYHSYYGASTPH